MNLKSKILTASLSFLVSVNSALAHPVSLESELFGYLESNAESLSVESVKSLNKTRNKDVANAYENYYQAKKNVSIARAQLSPVNTGLVLGVSLGATYLWAPIAINAVLSLPTKFYNIKKNEALRNAEYYFFDLAKDKLANEVSKLYFDILTNEFILKTIDLEVSLYNELYDSYVAAENVAKIKETHATILALQKESLTINDVVVSERAALNTMLSYGPEVELELGQDNRVLTEIASGATTGDYLRSKALKNSKDYKAKYWMHQAAIKNVKLVRWSIITINGLNFSYSQRVKVAKQEEKVAANEHVLSSKSAGNRAIDALLQLRTAKAFQDISEEKSVASLSFSAGVRTNYENGRLTLSDYVMTAVSAIRDFRSFVVSHYHTRGKMEDFDLAMGEKTDFSNSGVFDINNL